MLHTYSSPDLSNLIHDGRVAVIMRTKERPILLARALASIFSQTLTNWHLYLVNDGGDQAVVDNLVRSHAFAYCSQITVIHHKISLGMEAASNSALKRVEADFIVIHDDDDSWKPAFLKETVGFMMDSANRNEIAVATNYTVVNERIEGDQIIEESRYPWHLSDERIDIRQLLTANPYPPICLLFRSAALSKIGLFNADMPVLGDWDFNLRLASIGEIGLLKKNLAYYHHRHSGNQGSYGNSIIDGVSIHRSFGIKYRNHFLRQFLNESPENLGMMLTLLQKNDTIDWEMRHRLLRIEQILQPLETAFRPARWLWRNIMPLRRVVARLRGRI
ncbi:glycosyltransferase [Phyllobacterium sp. YR531]|uniref:glycosyltransferase family 2 protein n=1 Tax=Phyllobacterium sp. YR531 TaxID=1144343 RepID=UPI00026F49EA|nr:glycosyltransferase [Phyllobacterium sp. YR531]EJM99950.1 glycosyl transferase [Phyllobacterium sp. YR531]